MIDFHNFMKEESTFYLEFLSFITKASDFFFIVSLLGMAITLSMRLNLLYTISQEVFISLIQEKQVQFLCHY